MKINYSKIIFLNLIISILTFALFYNDTIVSMKGVIFLGFVSSFFFKENLLRHFLKLMFINTLVFHFLTVLITYLSWIIINNIFGEGNPYNLYSAFLMPWYMMLYSYGYVVGIVPQYIRERIQKNRTL